jgi:hypothetical protein
MMMSLRSWICLLIFYVVYLLMGGFTFQVTFVNDAAATLVTDVMIF